MRETEHFVNDGYGWACRRCRASFGADDSAGTRGSASADAGALARFFREGEAEEREVRLSSDALARWKDDSRRVLLCPRCGVEESVA